MTLVLPVLRVRSHDLVPGISAFCYPVSTFGCSTKHAEEGNAAGILSCDGKNESMSDGDIRERVCNGELAEDCGALPARNLAYASHTDRN